MSAAGQTTQGITATQGFLYGLLGLPLAFVALPLYVILPNHYAREFGVPLATLGAVLLGARLLDAVIDPLIGRFTDALFAKSVRAVLAWAAFAAVVLALGFAMLFFPLMREPRALILWASVMLVATYAAYSALSVAHQSWGAMLGGDEAQRSRIVSWREGLGLAGVLLASVLPSVVGLPVTTAVFFVALLCGWLAWSRAAHPVPQKARASFDLWLPFSRPAFRRLLAVFVLNGIASAVPATLVLFFVQDRLQAPRSIEPAFLGSYFLCAALSIPLWLLAVRRIGLARAWLCGMGLATAVFIWATQLGPGDTAAFIVVCALSGVALGTDLALPGAMLAGVIADAGDRGKAEGAYFGWWNFATKINLALAAGLALPLLGLFGYSPGARDPAALQALAVAYCLLPCLLKVAAAAALYFLIIKNNQGKTDVNESKAR
ncbi:MAG: MFS transporter [Comamonadaceae bacterium]|nr:MAG: MFS transporter [Comamonadaceae bacterium]